MSAEVESMVSVREVPWHGLGTIVQDKLTAEDALKESGLAGWDITKEEVFLVDGTKVPGKFATVRATDGKALGIVGKQYTVLQNEEAFSFMDALVDSGDAKYETAGSLRGGRHVWMMMTLPEGIKIAGEEIDLYLGLSNSHDGSSAVKGYATPVRVVCKNTENLAINSAKRSWSFRHVGSMDGHLDEARRALDLVFEYGKELQELGDSLATQKVSDREFENIVAQLTDVEEVFDGIVNNYHQSDNLNDIRGTKWGALNAVGEYYDHMRPTRTAEARFKSAMSGRGRRTRDQALELLLA